MQIGPDGKVRPDDPIATAVLTARVATGQLTETKEVGMITLHDHLVAWGEGRITHRDVMRRCQIDTLEGLVDAAFHSHAPFGKDEHEVAVRTVERLFANAATTNDALHAVALLLRRGIALDRVPVIERHPLVRRFAAEQAAFDALHGDRSVD